MDSIHTHFCYFLVGNYRAKQYCIISLMEHSHISKWRKKNAPRYKKKRFAFATTVNMNFKSQWNNRRIPRPVVNIVEQLNNSANATSKKHRLGILIRLLRPLHSTTEDSWSSSAKNSTIYLAVALVFSFVFSLLNQDIRGWWLVGSLPSH